MQAMSEKLALDLAQMGNRLRHQLMRMKNHAECQTKNPNKEGTSDMHVCSCECLI